MSVEQRKQAVPVAAIPVTVRKFPSPYRSMLAISSDIDLTTITRFRNVHRFLNTLEDTPVGPGVGLDIADSLWVFNDRTKTGLSLNDGYDGGRPHPWADELVAYAHAGWVDTLHTYGNYTIEVAEPRFERRHAELAIEELRARGLSFLIWVNHGSSTNSQNFGAKGEFMHGDVPGSPAYHTDLLLEYGIRFAWYQVGGTIPGSENPLTPMPLRDGQQVWGFSRFNGIRGAEATEVIARHAEFFTRQVKLRDRLKTASGIPATMLWWPALLDDQLSEARLDELVANAQYCVAAQHLGDLGDSDWLAPAMVETFRRLKRYQDDGLILVARTVRLLEYARVSQHLRFDVRGTTPQLAIDITGVADPVLGEFVPTLDQLRGLTFYVPEPAETSLLLAGVPIPQTELVRAPSDGTGPSIGVRWFAPDTTDYVALYKSGDAEPDMTPVATYGFLRLDPFPVEELEETSAAVDLSEFGLAHPLRHRYSATPRSVIPLVLEGVEIKPDDVFLHLSSGKGRMLLVAACHPFRRVVGVEIAEPMNDVARRNVEHNADRLTCTNVEVITADPADWPIPDDVTTVFFFNAFRGAFLDRALANIVASLDRRPRRLTFISLYPAQAEAIEATERFDRVRTVQFGEKPLEQIAYYESRA